MTGLVCVTFTATQPQVKAVLAKVGELNSTWDASLKGIVEKAVSEKLGRPVVLLRGNYVTQKKGVVSYHGAVKLPGSAYIEGGRKGWQKMGSNTFHLWMVLK